MGRKLGAVPFWERGAGSASNTVSTGLRRYLPTKRHLDPSSRLATTDTGRNFWGCAPLGGGAGCHQRDRHTDKQTDNGPIAWLTILQTVAQILRKSNRLFYCCSKTTRPLLRQLNESRLTIRSSSHLSPDLIAFPSSHYCNSPCTV